VVLKKVKVTLSYPLSCQGRRAESRRRSTGRGAEELQAKSSGVTLRYFGCLSINYHSAALRYSGWQNALSHWGTATVMLNSEAKRNGNRSIDREAEAHITS